MQKPLHRVQSGFSLVEALVALLIINLAVGSIFAGLTKLNEFAAINRLYTSAAAIVQARIDRSLIDKPNDPAHGLVHENLQVGTVTTPNLPVYKDPTTNQILVSGTMTTTVTSTTQRITTDATDNVTLQQTSVSLVYKYRGKDYNVLITSLRSPDSAP